MDFRKMRQSFHSHCGFSPVTQMATSGSETVSTVSSESYEA